MNGGAAGGNLWGNVQTSPGLAFGVSEPTQFGDPTAILVGSWGADQTAQATVNLPKGQPSSGVHEVEVRLRNTINSTAHTISGYELYCSVSSNFPYCHIAGWGGANGTYRNLDECANIVDNTTVLHHGDVLKGTVSGSNPAVVTMYINGVQHMQITDNGNIGGNCRYSDNATHGPYTSGNPGIGFYIGGASDWSAFGFSSFSAQTSGTTTTTPPAPTNVRVIKG